MTEWSADQIAKAIRYFGDKLVEAAKELKGK
jgi:hypothetical protein